MIDRFNGRSCHSCGIAFMAKASAPGRAKTRLVPPLTFHEAADLNTAFLQDVTENFVLADAQARAGAAQNAAIAGYAAYGSPGSTDFFRRILPASTGLIEAWRLLSARSQASACSHVRRHHLEHRAGGGADA